jgi:hypothetical protein
MRLLCKSGRREKGMGMLYSCTREGGEMRTLSKSGSRGWGDEKVAQD